VVQGGKTAAIGAVGFRKQGSPERVTVEDKFHIGSCTKSMTAVLVGMLVEEGKLSWTNTLADALPDLAPSMKPAWKSVTVENLLAHRGGVPGNLQALDLWSRLWDRAELPGTTQRAYLTSELLTKKEPVAAPGEKFIYANAGFAILGHIVELKLGQPWEEAMRKRLFKPLGMKSAGFGTPASEDLVDQPWGHTKGWFDSLKPVPPGISGDNPAAIGPGGTVHCSLADLAAYCNFQLGHTNGTKPVLRAETLKKLHAGKEGDYACGWSVLERRWGGRVLTHTGSNTSFFTVIWLAPEKDFAVAVCTNLGGDSASNATDAAAWVIIQKYLAQP
jgi:CubicO group peptidase (beta-lactamase class C family)